ncbi:MAG: hypothetical protein N2111_07495 [Candidatus Sumerlaeaceae bacterium]|nr:hypothetical protein [Candidatus Sumerlaeaceae bacterium]
MLVLIFGTVGLFIYLLRPYAERPRDQWLDRSTVAYGLVRLNPDDAGVAAVLRRSIRAINDWLASQTPDKPPPPQTITDDAVRMIPTFLIHQNVHFFVNRDDRTGTTSAVMVAQLRNGFAHTMTRMFFRSVASGADSPGGQSGLAVQRSRGVILISAARPAGEHALTLASAARAVLIGTDPEGVRRAVEASLANKPGSGVSDRLRAQLDLLDTDKPPPGEDLTVVVSNESGACGALMDALAKWLEQPDLPGEVDRLLNAQKLSMADITAARIGIDLASADTGRLEFALYCSTADVSKKVAIILREVAAQVLPAPADDAPIKTKTDVKQRGSAAILVIDLSGIERMLGGLFGSGPSRPRS